MNSLKGEAGRIGKLAAQGSYEDRAGALAAKEAHWARCGVAREDRAGDARCYWEAQLPWSK